MSKRQRIYLVIGSAAIGALALSITLNRKDTTPAWLKQFRANPLAPDTTPSWLKQPRRDLQEQLSRIHPDKGVDSSTAREIAQIYMNEYISGCGGPEMQKLIDGKWRSELRVGVTGRHSDTVIE